jgi:endogenous inhibitor of DNA gyrase (YacG/DUF329 family)
MKLSEQAGTTLCGSRNKDYITAMPDEAPATSAVPCPICGKPREQRFRPFCSRRCADVDLNRWLKGVYAVPVTENDDEDGDKIGDPKEA